MYKSTETLSVIEGIGIKSAPNESDDMTENPGRRGQNRIGIALANGYRFFLKTVYRE